MKSYIPKQPKHVRERIEAKVDARLVERLEKYCLYLDSDRDYVLAQVLELLFRKDKGFLRWLAAQGDTASPVIVGRTPQKGRALLNQQTLADETAPPAISGVAGRV